jgi:hypothetical protein
MKKSEEGANKKNTQLPSAFELAVLATFTSGNLHKAFQSYLWASEYLKANGAAELALQKGALSKKKIEAFVKLTSRGALDRGQAVIEYEKLVSGLKPALKLYKDERDDAVKSAIRVVTDRPCNYQTARDHLKKVWELKPARFTPRSLLKKIKTAANPWDSWCDAHTVVGRDKEKKKYRYLWVPGELINAVLHLCVSRKNAKSSRSKIVPT